MSKEVVYEVRCDQCQTSFAPGTRRCVHCGAPLRKGRRAASAAEDLEPERLAEETEVPTRGPRAAIWVVMALVTAVASVLRTCVE